MNSNATQKTEVTPQATSRNQMALMLAACIGLSTYLLVDAFGLPHLLYLPVEARFVLQAPPGAIVMGYYGIVINALLAFGLAFALGRLTPLAKPLQRTGMQKALARVMLAVFVFGLCYFLVVELMAWGSRHLT